jgi:ribA/ribD-fused uncharacterized protein
MRLRPVRRSPAEATPDEVVAPPVAAPVEPERFTFFYRGPYSQWAITPFEIDGVVYNCGEQYMMAEKARFFGDADALAEIMKARSPERQKALGRDVTPFDEDAWNAVVQDVIKRGNRAKFTQNRPLLKPLLATEGTTLVEASAKDKIYGIGLWENDARARDRSQWLGTNWLGQCETELREEFLVEYRLTGMIQKWSGGPVFDPEAYAAPKP